MKVSELIGIHVKFTERLRMSRMESQWAFFKALIMRRKVTRVALYVWDPPVSSSINFHNY